MDCAMSLDVYNLEISVWVPGWGDYGTNHRFAERPSAETVRALLDEAFEHYEIVFGVPEDEEDRSVSVNVGYVKPSERRPPGDEARAKERV